MSAEAAHDRSGTLPVTCNPLRWGAWLLGWIGIISLVWPFQFLLAMASGFSSALMLFSEGKHASRITVRINIEVIEGAAQE